MDLRFDGRVALVTGAGKGLGRAYAVWLAAHGAKVVVNNRVRPGQPSSAREVVEAIRAAGGEAVAAEAPVETEAGAALMLKTALDTWGRLDILVCNAGISPGGTFHKVDMALFREVFDVNYWGTVYPIRAALPLMREAGYGRVVITTSGSAYCGSFGLSAYGSAKAAVIGLARTLALENGEKNVRFNVISPVAFTPMTLPFMSKGHQALFPADAVSPMVGWLASEQCSASAAVIEAGGGRFRRVVFGVTDKVMEAAGDAAAGLWPELEELRGVHELAGAYLATRDLLPRPEGQ
jgi:NAD(P)-dependent dehydrogenase (short-subunit alcohol dehydrogenase family)